MDRFETKLERHQKLRGEPAYALAARLGLSPPVVYKMMGRRYKNLDGEFSVEYRILKIISDDTGIATDVLFEEAKRAALEQRGPLRGPHKPKEHADGAETQERR